MSRVKPFIVNETLIAPPLSVQATATKYGVSDRELRRVLAFVKRTTSGGEQGGA